MALPLYKFKNRDKLPEILKYRTFEDVRGAFESLDGLVFVTPKKQHKNVFERERSLRNNEGPHHEVQQEKS